MYNTVAPGQGTKKEETRVKSFLSTIAEARLEKTMYMFFHFANNHFHSFITIDQSINPS